MSRIKLDLSQFKHVKSDDKTTTLQHKEGHSLVLAHNALSKEAKGQLEALSKMGAEHQTESQSNEAKAKMAKGGEVKDKKPEAKDDKKSPETIQETSAANGVEAANAVRKDKKLPNGATILIEKVKKYAEGGLIDGILQAVQDYHNESDPDKPKAEVNRDPNKQKAAQVSKEVRGYAEGGGIETPPYIAGTLPEEAQSEMLQPLTHVPVDPQEMDFNAMNERRVQQEISKLKGAGDYTGQDPAMLESEALKNIDKQQESDRATEAALEAKKQADAALVNAQRAKLHLSPKSTEQVTQGAREPQAQEQEAQTPTVSQGLVSQNMPSSASPQGLGATSSDPESMLHQGYNQQIQGISQEAKAVGDLGQAQAAKIDETVQAQQVAKDAYMKQLHDLTDERSAIIQDIKDGHINPEQYWTGDPKTGEGSHSKIAAGIGMILAGFNPTNNPNAAIGFLKSQMDINLQAQMRNLGSKETLLSHNMQQYHNIKDAADMTRIMQNDMLAHQLDSAAAQAKNPMAQAAAKQAAGKLTMDSSALFQQFAMRRAMMGLAGGSGGAQNPQAIEQMMGYMRAVNPEMAKSMEQRYVPGIGLGSIPVPDAARKEIMGHQNLQAATQDLLQFTKQHTTLNPLSKEYAVGEQKARVLQSMVREGLLGTVYREGEQPLLDKFVSSNPGGALKMLNNAKLVELLHSNDRQANILRKQYGLPQAPMAQDNTPVKGADGRMYVRQGNYMVPVKSK